ncbi:MAG: NAD+ synthase [Candidatus Eisenbacteria sp.]|nr:NAD+ synthase [Candidatus Eisenbacteria bacterium]
MGRRKVLRAALAQINTTVGALQENSALVKTAYYQAIDAGASLVIFPELTLTGYPPEDLLLKPSFLEDTRAALEGLLPCMTRGVVIIGYTESTSEGPRNSAAVIAAARILDVYHKCTLPNYGVFDERRYFIPGTRCPVYELGPWRIAVNICEDLWVTAGVPTVQAKQGQANLMINLSASPYHAHKGAVREAWVSQQARHFGIPILYTNLTGGQDELVFDGQSLAVDGSGHLLARAPQFAPHILLVDLPVPLANGARGSAARDSAPGVGTDPAAAALQLDPFALPLAEDLFALRASDLPEVMVTPQAPRASDSSKGTIAPEGPRKESAAEAIAPVQHSCLSHGRIHPVLGDEQEVYCSLILGLRDYVQKNTFRGVVIGLSGGIDSALTAVIAADALGPDAVVGISMPTNYTADASRAGAAGLARNLGIEFHEIPITGLFHEMVRQLAPLMHNAPPDVTEENIQARLRGTILMAYSNKRGHLVLATGNKSEVAVGYCTLYGDMVGGFSVLKDVLKTSVYRLARWRNAQSAQHPPIPADTLSRPPSAELRPNQKDTDSLPPYETLDPIVKALVEDESSPRQIVSAGYNRELVDRIFRMIQGNEYKRRQAAPGIKITPRAFGRDRRYPLTNRYRTESRGSAGS